MIEGQSRFDRSDYWFLSAYLNVRYQLGKAREFKQRRSMAEMFSIEEETLFTQYQEAYSRLRVHLKDMEKRVRNFSIKRDAHAEDVSYIP